MTGKKNKFNRYALIYCRIRAKHPNWSHGHQKWHDCKHYDRELGCCKLLSNWTEAMPILMPCVDTHCEHYITE